MRSRVPRFTSHLFVDFVQGASRFPLDLLSGNSSVRRTHVVDDAESFSAFAIKLLKTPYIIGGYEAGDGYPAFLDEHLGLLAINTIHQAIELAITSLIARVSVFG
ncbi:MAG: hypothetical protein WKF63_10105 [Thermomicrobiales bacterium]